MFRFAKRLAAPRVCLTAVLGLLCCHGLPVDAQEDSARKAVDPERVVITSSKSPTDQEMAQRVEAALDASPYLDASRITVSTRNGIVSLEGVVGDYSDIRRAIRIAGRIPGIRRVEEDLYVPDFDNGP